MHIVGPGFPEGFDWNAYDRQKLQRRRSVEVRRRALQGYLAALQRILNGGATPFPLDQQLVRECVQLVFDEVMEDVRDIAELQHRHMAAPEAPPGPQAGSEAPPAAQPAPPPEAPPDPPAAH